MSQNDMSLEDLEKNLQNQIDKINDAIVKVRRNELSNINNMDNDIADLCRRILNFRDGNAKKFEGKMVEMINCLDELAVELKAYQERTTQDI
ncbi:MAG: hypothetical protein CO093_11105 [Alphaproteobacteria bacterium CG_4_9_14_3_um_filter_47_13]|nr:MAG: hypothetical protein CO093_11105 [Alphaproteobacteria bacterium CG_4_9_14_3_um_filter_47_13]